MKYITLFAGLGAALALSAAHAALPDLNLLVTHDITETGADGVTRSVRFQERVYRREGVVWVERVIPSGAHGETDHREGGHGHKHMDLAAAARWIALDKNKGLDVRLVNHHDKVVVNVPAAEYGNIGFDGSWENASHLLDPRQLKTMKALPGGRYETVANGNAVTVLWDDKAQVPRRVESRGRTGRKLLVAEDLPTPKTLPWSRLLGFQQKEYSDYLD